MIENAYDKYISTHFGSIHKGGHDEYEMYRRYFKKNYLKHMPKSKDAKILDIGCGMGHFLYFLEAEQYKNYLGIDISRENVDFCREKGFNVELNDLSSFLEDGKDFDLIVINDVVEHFNKETILKILRSVKTNLKDSGTLIIKVPNAANPIMASSSRYFDFTHEIIFTEESLSQVFMLCGFRNHKIYPQDIYIFYNNPLNYIAKFMSWAMTLLLRSLFVLYGRKTTQIFTKDLIAVANK